MRPRVAILLLALLAASCSDAGGGDTTAVTTPASSSMATTTATAPGAIATTTGATTTTDAPPTGTDAPRAPDWPASTAEQAVENFLAALAAGAYAQAGWPMENLGGAYDDAPDELPSTYLGRVCADGSCAGPYHITTTEPAPAGGLPAWIVTVEHEPTGAVSELRVGYFEGRLAVAGLPPLVAGSTPPEPLVVRLFGDDVPDQVVVARYEAFEVWDDGEPAWFTNWFAGEDYLQVESGYLAAGDVVAPIDDPFAADRGYQCPRLVDRDGLLLVLERCTSAEAAYTELATGEPAGPPGVAPPSSDCETAFWDERAGVVIASTSDAEGNLCTAVNEAGFSLIGDDYPGLAVISNDGRWFVYADHRDQASPHFSSVLVVRRISDGAEMYRTTVEGVITCLEASGGWVLACDADPLAAAAGEPAHDAIIAINLATGEEHRVATRARVYLPVY